MPGHIAIATKDLVKHEKDRKEVQICVPLIGQVVPPFSCLTHHKNKNRPRKNQ